MLTALLVVLDQEFVCLPLHVCLGMKKAFLQLYIDTFSLHHLSLQVGDAVVLLANQVLLEVGLALYLLVGGLQASELAEDLIVVLTVVLDGFVGQVLLLDHELVAPLPVHGS